MSHALGVRIRHVAGDDVLATRTLTSGSVRVEGIIVANTDDADEDTVTFTKGDGTTLLTIECGPNDSESFEVPWLAEAGLIVVSAAAASTTFVTVIHGQDGA